MIVMVSRCLLLLFFLVMVYPLPQNFPLEKLYLQFKNHHQGAERKGPDRPPKKKREKLKLHV